MQGCVVEGRGCWLETRELSHTALVCEVELSRREVCSSCVVQKGEYPGPTRVNREYLLVHRLLSTRTCISGTTGRRRDGRGGQEWEMLADCFMYQTVPTWHVQGKP